MLTPMDIRTYTHTHTHKYIYIYICVCVCVCVYRYVVPSIGFQTFFVRAFKIVVDTWKFTTLLLSILWDDWPIFSDFRFKWTAKAGIWIHPDYHSRWISKMQSGREEERYAIKFGFKLGKNATEMYGILQTAFRPPCVNWAPVFKWHKRFEEGRESREGSWEVWEE